MRRKVMAFSSTGGAATYTISKTFTAGASATITSAAMFNAAGPPGSGTLFVESVRLQEQERAGCAD
jgi:hypothetical protein